MTMQKIKGTWQQRNVIEATLISRTIRKLSGLVVFVQEVNERGQIKTKLSYLGSFCFLFWCSLYGYCGYVSRSEGQTILRKLYNTKLEHYGDNVEWGITVMYVIFGMWRIPFVISGSVDYIQIILNIDNAIRELDYDVNYSKCGQIAFILDMSQFLVAVIHWISLWLTQGSVSEQMPYALMFQVVFANAVALAGTSQYCFHLYLIRERFRKVNAILGAMPLSSYIGSNRAIQIKDRELCETVRSSAKIYSMLHRAVRAGNKVFGMMIVTSMVLSLLYIILYLFYLMEATAAKMFQNDSEKYIYFLVHIIWEILHAFLVIFLCVYSNEITKKEARLTANFTHDVLNANLSPEVSQVTIMMSQQLLHQSPVYTVAGLYRLEYVMLIRGARIVAIFLVMLLQYAGNYDY